MTKLICPDCRHENEPERIYCHNCGGRLDRSKVRKEKIANDETLEGTQQRLQKLFDPNRGRTKRLFVKLGKLLVGALCFAVLIQMFLPPDLPAARETGVFAPMISMDLLTALERPTPSQLTYSQEQVNAYLASAIRRKGSPAQEGFFPIHRLAVELDEGRCLINVEQRFFGLTISDGSAWRVAVEQGKINATCVGGYIGRMPIHPLPPSA